MYVSYTDEEMEYMIKEPFNWHPSEDAPAEIKESINRKLEARRNSVLTEDNWRRKVMHEE